MRAGAVDVDGLCGRDLDALVAESLFGLEVQRRPDRATGKQDVFYNTTPRARAPSWVRLPEYSQCLAASIDVEKKLQEWGWRRHTPPPGWRPGPEQAITLVLERRDKRRVQAVGPYETALCRAALKAVIP